MFQHCSGEIGAKTIKISNFCYSSFMGEEILINNIKYRSKNLEKEKRIRERHQLLKNKKRGRKNLKAHQITKQINEAL
jgi:hypothetical protein